MSGRVWERYIVIGRVDEENQTTVVVEGWVSKEWESVTIVRKGLVQTPLYSTHNIAWMDGIDR